jgi:hypothetical protein
MSPLIKSAKEAASQINLVTACWLNILRLFYLKRQKVFFAHNVSFWVQKMTHNISFFGQKLSESFLSAPKLTHLVSFWPQISLKWVRISSGPRN